MSGVEPRVPDLRNPARLAAARLAANRHLVDPRPMKLLQLPEPARGPLLELGARPNHVQTPALARVEREREPEVPLPRDVPVVHVAEPVVHPLAVEIRRPLDRRVRVEERLADLVGGDEPVVDDTKDERCAAAPADRVAVRDPPCLEQQAALV